MISAVSSLDDTPPPSMDAVTSLPAQIWRRRRLFGLVFALALLPALGAILLLRPVYYASGAVMIGNQEPASSSVSAAWIEKLGDPADLESQLLIALSHRMVRLALARPGVIDAVLQECRISGDVLSLLRRGENCAKLTPGSQELLDHVEARYSVHAVGRSRIISIGYQSPLPDVAFVLANALLITYVEDQRAENGLSREATAAWLLKEADKFKTDPNQTVRPDGLDGPGAQSRQKFYQDLYNRTNDFETERRALVAGGRLVSLAEVPAAPCFPKRTPLLAAGLTIATILAMLAALYRDIADRSVRRPRELEALTQARVLGLLPPVEKAAAHTGLRMAFGQENPTVREAAGALYSRLMLMGGAKAQRRILITSTAPGEGKTFTAMALARAAAESGRKALVIDCNMRRQIEVETPWSSPAIGLADILRGEIEPHQAVVQSDPSGFAVIKAGSPHGDPSLLLINSHFPKLLSWAEQYDLVLLDGSSAGLYPDAGVLTRHTDGVLWCVQWGRTLQQDVVTIAQELRKRRVNLLGLAVTMAPRSELRLYERPSLLSAAFTSGPAFSVSPLRRFSDAQPASSVR
jgi:Mrp family chromosome partitioning ATPase